MAINPPGWAPAILALTATYLLHSTMLLAGAWLVLKLTRTSSHVLTERIWKLAAVLALATAPLQMSLGWSQPFVQLTLRNGLQEEVFRKQASLDTPDVGTASTLDLRPFESVDPLVAEPAAALPSDTLKPLGDIDSSLFATAGSLKRPDADSADADLLAEDDLASLTAPSASRERNVNGTEDALARTSQSATARISSPDRGTQGLIPILVTVCAIAIAGCVFSGVLLQFLWSLRLRRRLAGARPLGAGAARLLLDRFLQRNLIRRRVRLLSTTTFAEPVTFGIFRWTIVLPAATEERLNKEELRALLAHEVAHLMRGDVWWLWIGRLLCSCLVFQPFNIMARRRWQQAAEYLCDDWAVQRGVRGLSLARCLTQIAQWRFGAEACEAGLAAGGSRASLVRRVERLVDDPRHVDVWSRPLGRSFFALLTLIVAAGFAVFAPCVDVPVYGRMDRPAAAAVPPPTPTTTQASDWRSLEEELLQLDADLTRAGELLHQIPFDHVSRHSAENLRRRANDLRQRRRQIAELIRKESE